MRVSSRLAFFINSALAFASAELLTAALHEAGHGIVAQFLGFAPKIFAFYEDNPSGNAWQSLEILAAGPIASLILGAGFWLWCSGSRPGYSFGKLLLAWLALLGVAEFVNYLIVTPWLADGDTAQFTNILHWSIAERYGMLAIGVAFIFALGRLAAKLLFSVAPKTIALDSPRAQRRFVMLGFYLPLVVGIALTAVAGIGGRPLNVFYGLLATLGNIDIVVAAMYAGDARTGEAMASAAEGASDAPLRIEPVAILLYVAMVLTYIFALSRGVPI